jgi:hypothetical protein
MAERALSKVQFGLESARGTAVAADTLLLGAEIAAVPVDRVPVFPEDALGVRARSSRNPIYQYLAQNTLTIPHGYFEILPFFLSLATKGGVTPAEQTPAEGDMLWNHTPSLTATNAIDTVTLEVGDDTDAYEVEYVMFERLKFAGVVAQGTDEAPVSIEADYFGRQVTKTSFTGAITAPTVTTMNAGLSRFYADPLWANIGTTEVTSLIRAWELEILTGLHPKFFGSANRFFDTHGEGFIDVMLNLTFEGGASADAERDLFVAGTQQAIQIQVLGPQIGAGDVNSLIFSVYGAYENVIPLAEEDRGNNLHTAVFHGMYDTTGAAELDIQTTNETAAL